MNRDKVLITLPFVASAIGLAALCALAMAQGSAQASSGAQGAAAHSPGVASGNAVQMPVHVPTNQCGNTVNVIGALNPAFGNHCANGG